MRWVAASELGDPTPFLQGGELLLTTGLNTGGWTTEWSSYVARLAVRGVSGLGFGTGLTHARVPDELVAECRALGMNLVEVPEAVAFVAVSRVVADLLNAQGRQADRESAERQQRLIALAGRTDAVDSMLSELADAVAGAAAVVDRAGQPVAGPSGEFPSGFDPELIAREVARLRSRRGPVAGAVSEAGVCLEVQPLGSGDRPSQFLAVVAPGAAVGRAHRSAVTTVVALLSLHVDAQQQQLDAERELRAKALSLLSRDQLQPATLVLDVLGKRHRLSRRAWFVRASGEAEALAHGLVQAERRGVLAASSGEELQLLVSTREQLMAELLPELLAAGLRVGISSPVEAAETGRGHERAGLALAGTSQTAPVVWWPDLIRKGAGAILDPRRAEAWSISYLEGLDGVLRKTLECFLRQHGSRGKVGDELHVHRNTVRSRLAQIEKSLGASLDDPDTRVNAWLALRLQSR